VSTNQLRIGNCIDTLVNSYSPVFPPIVYGDTRNLRMGPHNAMYAELPNHLKRANIKFEQKFDEKEKSSDWFVEAINNFRKPLIMAKG